MKSFLLKSRQGFPVGTIKEWNGKKYQKFTDGTWRLLRNPKQASATNDLSSHYLKEIVIEGHDDWTSTRVETQKEFLLKDTKLKELKWTKPFSDMEQGFHVRMTAMAMADLTEALELPHEMGSFNGRLSMTIAAKQQKKALASYDRAAKTISITDNDGEGSLAHEWAHFFDHTLAEVMTGKKSEKMLSDFSMSLSDRKDMGSEELAILRNYNKIRAIIDTDLKDRMASFEGYSKLTKEARKYWETPHECFSRCFEKYLTKKMELKGKKNTYLAGPPNHPYWPDEAITAKMMPYFDGLFNTFRNSAYLKKAFLNAISD